MDLSVSTGLGKQEHFLIAADMHAKVLDELFWATKWKSSEAVFHGGTALALGHRSERFSEDLDFMVDGRAAQDLDKVMGEVLERVRLAMSLAYPGCSVALKLPKGTGEVNRWTFTWSHPNRRGNVKVHAEFLKTTADLLRAYQTSVPVTTAKGTIGIRAPIPMPTLLSAWADKIKAVATRPAVKWRDIYDIAFILRSMHPRPADDEKVEALSSTAAIYGRTLDDVARGLEVVLAEGILDDREGYEADMARWFDDEYFERHFDQFGDQLRIAKAEVELAVSLCRSRGYRP